MASWQQVIREISEMEPRYLASDIALVLGDYWNPNNIDESIDRTVEELRRMRPGFSRANLYQYGQSGQNSGSRRY